MKKLITNIVLIILVSFSCFGQGGFISNNISTDKKIEELISKASMTDDDLYEIVQIIQKNGDFELGIRVMNVAVVTFPDNYYPYYMRGFYYKNLSNDKAAIADFTQAIQLEPRYASSYLERGECYARLNDKIKARNDFNSTIARIKELKKQNLQYSGMEVAEQFALVGLGQYQNVENWVKNYNGDDWYDIACLFAKMNNKNKTLFYLNKALESGYENVEFIKRDGCMQWLANSPEFIEIVEQYK